MPAPSSQLPAWRWLATRLRGLRWAVVGGGARDLALGRPARDLDVAVEASADTLDATLAGLPTRTNRFGGRCLQHPSGIAIDLWQIADTWAFRSGHVELGPDPFQSFPRTTFLDIDGLMWLGHSGEFLGLERFRRALRSQTVDIELEQNPAPHAAAVRSLSLARRYGLRPSARLRSYISAHAHGDSAKHYERKRLGLVALQLGLPRLYKSPAINTSHGALLWQLLRERPSQSWSHSEQLPMPWPASCAPPTETA